MTTFNKITEFKNIEYSWKQTQRGDKKFKSDSIKFSFLLDTNLVQLWRSLKAGTYTMSNYVRFKVYEPKERVISAPRIRDKVVQFAVHEVIKDIYEPIFIKDNYACRPKKGTHAAVQALQHYMRLCRWQYGDGWVVKLDVKKFFYSIDRSTLKQILRKKISCKRTLQLLDKIIDSSPEGATGIPLGNVTSQDFANIYMNELDQYVKRCLGIKWYVRYMDDVIAVVETKDEATDLLNKMVRFLNTRLKLDINNKTKVFPLQQGVNAYGFKIYTTHKLVRNSAKAGMKRRIKAMNRKLNNGELPLRSLLQAVNSWLGHAKRSNSYNLCKKIFNKYPYVDIENKGGLFYGDILRTDRTGRPI